MSKRPQDTPAEEPDGGNPHIRFRGGPGLGDRPGLLNKSKKRWDRATPSARSAWRTAPLLTLALATPLCAQTAPPPSYSTVITTAPDPLLNNLSILATATTQGMWSSTQH